ncbi:hypothetical protein SAMN05660297_01381 [Natronincola peptidivorans]|uniref:Uncharacterized protein n=1 Tax=Natronincola peptidivorans TaxID=426128 RepID=A0A1I0BQX6_9FIRM|nr:hypothetical protein [Natronincola peptidivorans]SET09351.1 hypothetical protein SAMN05660297_01381 [Natronincola peptidivorans]
MKKHEVFTIILMIILLITTFNQGSTIHELRNTINHQSHQISALQNGVQGIYGSVNNSLSNWERENRWLHSSKNIISSISNDGNDMEVIVSWQFNELRNDEEVYLMVGEKINTSEYKWEKIKVDTDNQLHFDKTLTLPLRGDYKFDTIAENTEGSRLAELGTVELYRSLKERFQVHGNIHARPDNKAQIFVDLFVEGFKYFYHQNELSDSFISKLEIESVFVEVYLDGQLVKNFDLLEETAEKGHRELEKQMAGYPTDFMHIYQNLEVEELPSGTLSAIVKITDGLGEIYELPLR